MAEPVAFPAPGDEVTQILVVSDLDRSRTWWVDVLGAEVHREYGGTSIVLAFAGAWLLLVTGGPPTEDKPGITFTADRDPSRVSHALTVRVADCRGAYATLRARGADFLSPPRESEHEIRVYARDPDGHLVELSQAL